MEELDLGEPVIKDNELKMAIQLAEMGANDEFQPENYRDEVKERIRGLIQKKIDGEEITVTAGEEPRAQVIDLMEALRASLERKGVKPAAKAAEPSKGRKPARRVQDEAAPAPRKTARK
jgi:DNA end-binding protein Ku